MDQTVYKQIDVTCRKQRDWILSSSFIFIFIVNESQKHGPVCLDTSLSLAHAENNKIAFWWSLLTTYSCDAGMPLVLNTNHPRLAQIKDNLRLRFITFAHYSIYTKIILLITQYFSAMNLTLLWSKLV